MFKYLPHTSDDIKKMLDVVGVNSIEELYSEIPEELKLKRELQIPSAKSEIEVRKVIQGLADKNKPLLCFAGAGTYDHYIPTVVPYIAGRSEFATSYTPYQAEVSQGTLAYVFEFQSMIADLTGMDIANASMYDDSTATAEAMMMCVAASKKRNKVLMSSTFNPDIIRVAETYAKFRGIELTLVPASEGIMDKEEAKKLIANDDIAGLIVTNTNYYGFIEDLSTLADVCHEHKTLFVVNTVASALSVLTTPGELGADIACGSAQSLGIPMAFGGPHIGYFCTTNELVRKMPGRLVGATTDTEGRRTFVLTMQAREQHIRREKATSNICTSQGLMCLYVASYLSLMGEQGLLEVNQQSYATAHYLHDELLKTGVFEDCFPTHPFLNEFTVKANCDAELLRNRLAEEGFLLGVITEGLQDCLTIATTELRSKEEIDTLVKLIKEIFSAYTGLEK